MLRGVDVSSYQAPGSITYKAYDFVIIKASEGKNYKDPALDGHLTAMFGSSSPTPRKDLCYGFYHYARPDLGNTPQQEADSFLSYISSQIGNCVMALDWEQKALNYSVSWAKAWLDYVYQKTGIKPLLYIQGSQAKLSKYAPIANADYGLWVAHWDTDYPSFSNWKSYALWQYRGSPLDLDYFNGDKNAWWRYCGRKDVEEMDENKVRQIAQEEIKKFFDALGKKEEVSGWAKDDVKWAMDNGVMNGDVAGDITKFRPHDFPTRQELAVTTHNLYSFIEERFNKVN